MSPPSFDGGESNKACLFCDSRLESDIIFDEISRAVSILLHGIPAFLPDEWFVRAIQLRTAELEKFCTTVNRQ